MQRLFIVQIEHEQGTNVYPATTEELAWAVVHAWVKEYWDDDLRNETIGEEIGPIPDSKDEAIKLYFDAHQMESFAVDTHILIDGPQSLAEVV